MDAVVPDAVARRAGELDLGERRGRFPQAMNKVMVFVIGLVALQTMCAGLATAVGGGANSMGTVAVCAVATVLLVWVCVQILRNRAFYLYRGGIVVTNWRGRIDLAARWVDLQLYRQRVGLITGAQLPRDTYRLVVNGRTGLRHGEPYDAGPGRLMRELSTAHRLPDVTARLENGEDVAFGPVTVSSARLTYQDNTLAWSQIASAHHRQEGPSLNEDFLIVPTEGPPLALSTAKVPDTLVLERLVGKLAGPLSPPG